MKIFLFGGAEVKLGQFLLQLKLIEQVILECNPAQVLHIPFARIDASEPEWQEGWFGRNINIGKIEYLNAKNKEDIARADLPLVFMSGGGENINLLEKIKTDPRLLKLVQNASCIIGESAGAKILGAYFRTKGSDNSSAMVPGLGIIKDSVIEPHYKERNRQDLLIQDMQETGVKYGVGIDTVTAISFEADYFPNNITKIGEGSFVVKNKSELNI